MDERHKDGCHDFATRTAKVLHIMLYSGLFVVIGYFCVDDKLSSGQFLDWIFADILFSSHCGAHPRVPLEMIHPVCIAVSKPVNQSSCNK